MPRFVVPQLRRSKPKRIEIYIAQLGEPIGDSLGCWRRASALPLGISAVRKSRSMTVDQLAVASRIDSSNIRGYEAGRGLMNVQSLVRIAEALGVDAGELLSGVTSEMFAQER